MNPFLSAFLSRRLIDRKDGHRRQVIQNFKESVAEDWLSPEEARRNREARLANLLSHAGSSVPFYRALLKGRVVRPQEAVSVLHDLPVVGREDFQKQPAAFVSERAGESFDDFTGGSTGTPMKFKVDRPTKIAREASLFRADSLAGWSYGERIAMLWGSDRDFLAANQQFRARLRWWIENRRWFNAFDLDPARMDQFHHELESFRPHILVAYAGTLFTFARHLKQSGVRPHYPVRALITSAEVCTTTMRAVIESAFPAKVFDRYGNREAGGIASECNAHDGLHVNTRDFFVEAGTPGASAPIIITYFANHVMPLIRYNTQDVGFFQALEKCSCGRTSPRLGPVQGRVSDTIRTASGKLVHGEFFTHLMYGADGVRNFQFIQESPHGYRLLVEGDRILCEPLVPGWRNTVLEVVGRDAQLQVDFVEKIPVLKSGKHRFTFSMLKENPYESAPEGPAHE